ncbi:hypothetical protein HDU96_001520 [Phlyctochytrium bullatum]|nr:hypothetical protein HDU96_001520 [Phlyctochytrium bullatum]
MPPPASNAASGSTSAAPQPTPILRIPNATVDAIAQACQILSRRPRSDDTDDDESAPRLRRTRLHEKRFDVTVSIPAEQCPGLVAGLLRGVDSKSADGEKVSKPEALPENVELLHHASQREDVATVRKLLAAGTPYDVKDADGLLPLQKSFTMPVWKAFAEKMLAPKDMDLFAAAKLGDGVATRLLVATGSNPTQSDHLGVTPLHLAVMGGHEDVADVLMKCREVRQKSLDARATIWIQNHGLQEDVTPLHLAATQTNSHVLTTLLNHDPVIDATDSLDATPLYRAVMAGNLKAVEVLLQSGADIDINALLYSGADIDASDDHRISLFTAAIRSGRVDICRLLLDHGADADNALLEAMWCKNVDLVKLLIEFDANVNMKDKFGKTLLHLAEIVSTKEIVDILKQHGARR